MSSKAKPVVAFIKDLIDEQNYSPNSCDSNSDSGRGPSSDDGNQQQQQSHHSNNQHVYHVHHHHHQPGPPLSHHELLQCCVNDSHSAALSAGLQPQSQWSTVSHSGDAGQSSSISCRIVSRAAALSPPSQDIIHPCMYTAIAQLYLGLCMYRFI